MHRVKRYAPAIVSFLLLIAGWFYATWSTRNAPSYDGSIIYGFPFPFGWEGGMCASGYCPLSIQYPFLALDILILLMAPVAVQAFAIFWRKRK